MDDMKTTPAHIVREYGPFDNRPAVHGVSFDGKQLWFASGEHLNAVDPDSGQLQRSLPVQAHAGTAFDGRYLYQIADSRIQKIDPDTGAVLSTIPTPEGGGAGLTWAEGSLWIGQHRARKIHRLDPQTGAILSTMESKRFVTGVTWLNGELWHATWEDERSDLRQVDPGTGAVLESVELPPGVLVSGLESDGVDQFFCGGGGSGKIRVVRRPG
jgi:glutamine cyclotransferase